MSNAVPTSGPIIFYDGACGLCDRSVRWVMAHDRDNVFRFAPLQGETYAALDQPDKPRDISSLVLLHEGKLLTRTDALIGILDVLGRGWKTLARLGRMTPRCIRDPVYRLVARHRKRFFGGAEACQLPTKQDRDRLLP